MYKKTLFLFIVTTDTFSTPPLTMVCNSFNRPMQLYAHLESVKKFIPNLQDVHIIYRASNKKYLDAYHIVQKDFSDYKFHQQGITPHTDYKPLIMQSAFTPMNGYIMFSVDDIIVKDFIDVELCMSTLQKTGAYGFYLRLGKNINYCYMLGKKSLLPRHRAISNDIISWSFLDGTGDWRYPHSVDMSIYKKSDVVIFFRKNNFSNPNTLESTWTRFPSKNNFGLCFNESKIVNIPANLVNPSKNRHAKINDYTPEALLNKFLEGYKIDTTKFYRIANNSPHQEYPFNFVLREGNS